MAWLLLTQLNNRAARDSGGTCVLWILCVVQAPDVGPEIES